MDGGGLNRLLLVSRWLACASTMGEPSGTGIGDAALGGMTSCGCMEGYICLHSARSNACLGATWNDVPAGTGLTTYICWPGWPYGVLPPYPGVTISIGDVPYTGPGWASTKDGCGPYSAAASPPPPIGDVSGSMNGECASCCASLGSGGNATCRS